MSKNVKKMRLYFVDDSLIKYYNKNIDKRVWWNKENPNGTARVHTGILIEMGSLLYIAPMTSDKGNRYRNSNDSNVIKLVKLVKGSQELYFGAVLLNYMIPVTKDLIKDVRNSGSLTVKKQYVHAMQLEILDNRNKNNGILIKAIEHYLAVVKDKNPNAINRSLKYTDLEKGLEEFLKTRGKTINIDRTVITR